MPLQKRTYKVSTGYFARASEGGKKAVHTKVHLVSGRTALCGYMPHPSMSFQWCASSAILDYVECKACTDKYMAKLGLDPVSKDLELLRATKSKLTNPEHVKAMNKLISDVVKKSNKQSSSEHTRALRKIIKNSRKPVKRRI